MKAFDVGSLDTAGASGPPRFAWMITGSGHLLEESLALAAQLPGVDLVLSRAGEEVREIYGLHLEDLRKRFRVIRDKTASAVPVGLLYDHHYHTVVIAPATSNTVAKCAFGISDSLPSTERRTGRWHRRSHSRLTSRTCRLCRRRRVRSPAGASWARW